MKTENEKKIVTIEFSNEAAAKHFASWLCGSGEQQYWDWMEIRESEMDEDDEGDITAINFDYHSLNDNKFGVKIKTECGRLNRLGLDEEE